MFNIVEYFKPRSYPELMQHPLSKSLIFLLAVVVVLSSVFAFRYTLIAREWFPEIKDWVLVHFDDLSFELPIIEIKDGMLILPREPFIKEFSEQFIFAIEQNTAGAYDILEPYPFGLVLTENKIITKTIKGPAKNAKIETNDYKDIAFFKLIPKQGSFKLITEGRDFDITSESVNNLVQRLKSVIYLVLLVSFFLYFVIAKPIQVFIMGVLAMVIAQQRNLSLSHLQLWNLSVYALVPATTIALVKDLLFLQIPGFNFIYFGVYAMYLFKGIKPNGEEL